MTEATLRFRIQRGLQGLSCPPGHQYFHCESCPNNTTGGCLLGYDIFKEYSQYIKEE